MAMLRYLALKFKVGSEDSTHWRRSCADRARARRTQAPLDAKPESTTSWPFELWGDWCPLCVDENGERLTGLHQACLDQNCLSVARVPPGV